MRDVLIGLGRKLRAWPMLALSRSFSQDVQYGEFDV
jgi:hypothetical protein